MLLVFEPFASSVWPAIASVNKKQCSVQLWVQCPSCSRLKGDTLRASCLGGWGGWGWGTTRCSASKGLGTTINIGSGGPSVTFLLIYQKRACEINEPVCLHQGDYFVLSAATQMQNMFMNLNGVSALMCWTSTKLSIPEVKYR